MGTVVCSSYFSLTSLHISNISKQTKSQNIVMKYKNFLTNHILREIKFSDWKLSISVTVWKKSPLKRDHDFYGVINIFSVKSTFLPKKLISRNYLSVIAFYSTLRVVCTLCTPCFWRRWRRYCWLNDAFWHISQNQWDDVLDYMSLSKLED